MPPKWAGRYSVQYVWTSAIAAVASLSSSLPLAFLTVRLGLGAPGLRPLSKWVTGSPATFPFASALPEPGLPPPPAQAVSRPSVATARIAIKARWRIPRPPPWIMFTRFQLCLRKIGQTVTDAGCRHHTQRLWPLRALSPYRPGSAGTVGQIWSLTMRAVRRFTVRASLPEPLAGLGALATNLRWPGHPPTRDLFASMDTELFNKIRDPLRMLTALPAARIAEL